MTTNHTVHSVYMAAIITALITVAWTTNVRADWDYCFTGNNWYSPTHVIDGALHLSSREGATETVEKLLNAGANPDISNSFGYAPLHVAAMAGHTAVAEALLNSGANPNAVPVKAASSDKILRRCSGFTPLHFAGRAGHTDIVDALLSAGADPNLAAKDGTTAIYWADRTGHVDAVVSLLTAGATHQ